MAGSSTEGATAGAWSSVTFGLHTCPARLPCRAVQHTYLACGLIARGSVAPSDLTRGIGRLRQQMRMAPWAEEAFKTGLCSCPPVGELRRDPSRWTWTCALMLGMSAADVLIGMPHIRPLPLCRLPLLAAQPGQQLRGGGHAGRRAAAL